MTTFSRKCLIFVVFAGLLVSAKSIADEGYNMVLQTEAGCSFQVYVTGPKDARHGILLVHGWWGLNDQARSWADRFSALGYRVMAIDLYNGRVATTPDKARAYMNEVKQSEANEKYLATLKALQMPGRKLATIGWSFGGTQALQASLAAPESVTATVMFYPFGGLSQSRESLASLNGTMLLIRAKQESPAIIEDTDQFIVAAKKAGKSIQEHTYNAKHGFTNPSAKHHDAQATEAAWNLTKKFLEEQLR